MILLIAASLIGPSLFLCKEPCNHETTQSFIFLVSPFWELNMEVFHGKVVEKVNFYVVIVLEYALFLCKL